MQPGQPEDRPKRWRRRNAGRARARARRCETAGPAATLATTPLKLPCSRRTALRLASLPLLASLFCASANPAEPGWQEPSPAIRAVLDAPALPQAELSPDQATLALLTLRRHPRLAELARPVLGLAGRRFDPDSSGPARTPEIESLLLRGVEPGSAERRVALPEGGGFHALRWAPDGRHFLLRRRTGLATELWVGETASGRLRQVPGLRLNAVLSSDIAWLGAEELVVLAVPEARGPAPRPGLPAGPVVQEARGRASPERTLQNLLRNAEDAALFAHHAQSVLRRVRLSAGDDPQDSREIGEPALYAELGSLGEGGMLMVQTLLPPFSLQVGASDFAREVALLDTEGRRLHTLGRIALREGVAVGGVVAGPRSWWGSPFADAAVYWAEAWDLGPNGGDRLLRLEPPYNAAPQELLRAAGRIVNLAFLQPVPGAPARASVTEVERSRQWLSTRLLALDGSAPPQLLSSRSTRDRYADPGQPLSLQLPNGRTVLRTLPPAGHAGCAGGCLWWVGDGASAQGERPFLDRLALTGLQPDSPPQPNRLLQSPPDRFERTLALLPDGRLLARSESAEEPPNLLLRSGRGWPQAQWLTRHADPAPQLRSLRRTLVQFQREDGVALSYWQVLPPEDAAHQAPGQPRPTLVWAYPQEFADADTAGQVSGSPHRFVSVGPTSPLLLALDGIVVLMDATMPVVGDPKTVNDRFVEQISANARAIVQQAVAQGHTDARRVVVGGHSYGAFMAANLLAHTDLFAAGIARSGAYNRTLTPFGFQAERRSFWQAPEVYQRLSPFNVADRIKAPLLLVHGEADDNPGTFPLQSQRMFQALAGTGGVARFVSLPHEGHNYAARESVGQVLREMSDWVWRHAGPAAGQAADAKAAGSGR